MDDRELDRMLDQWKAPRAPRSLGRRVLPRVPWWRWMLTGSVRVPVPVGVAAVLLLGVGIYFVRRERPVVESKPASVSLADFQPVKQMEPRVIRRANGN